MSIGIPFKKETLAGIFVAAGIALIAYGVFTLGKKEGYAEDRYQLRVLFKDIRGLSQGAAVLVAGVNVGSVSDIRFTTGGEEQEVEVTLTILKKFQKQIREGSLFSITTEGILGNQYVSINPGQKGSPPLSEGSTVVGQEPYSFREIAAQLEPLLEEFTETIVSLKNTSDRVAVSFQGVSTSARVTLGSIEKLSGSLSESAKETLISLRQTTESYGKLSHKVETALDSLTATSDDLRRLTQRIEKRVISGKVLSVF